MVSLIHQKRFGIPIGLILSVLGIIFIFEFKNNFLPIFVGIVFLGLGLFLLINGINRYNWFKSKGIKVTSRVAFITKEVVRINKWGWANNQIIFKITSVADNPVSKEPNYYFVSDALYFQFPEIKAGEAIDVYVDVLNAKNYWVDISKIKTKPMKLSSVTSEPGFYKSLDGVNYHRQTL